MTIINKIFFLVLIVISTSVAFPVSALMPGAGDIYTSSVCFNITASSNTGALTNYPKMVSVSNASGVSGSDVIYTGGSTRPDWKDLNWTDGTGNTQINNWRENNTQTSTISYWWITPPTTALSPGTRVCAYFGNSSQTNENGGFSLINMAASTQTGDDFNSAVNSSMWNTLGAGGSVSSGILTISGANAWTGHVSKTAWGSNYSFRARAARSSVTVQSDTWLGLARGGASPDRLVITKIGTGNTKALVVNGGSETVVPQSALSTSYIVEDIIRNSSFSGESKVNNANFVKSTTNLPTTTEQLNATMEVYQSGYSETIDWVFVRPYQYPEPVSSDYVLSGLIIPVASFAQNKTVGTYNFPIQFTDTSSTPGTNWYWDFGDITNSTLQNPVHTYTSNGVFNVSFKAENPNGSSWYNLTGNVDSLPPITSYGNYSWSVLNGFSTDPTLTASWIPESTTSALYKNRLLITHQSNSSSIKDSYVTAVNLTDNTVSNVYTQNGGQYYSWRVKNVSGVLYYLISKHGDGVTWDNNGFWLYNTTDLVTWNLYNTQVGTGGLNSGNMGEDFIFYNGKMLVTGSNGNAAQISNETGLVYSGSIANTDDGLTIQQPNSSLLVVGDAYPLDFITSNNGIAWTDANNGTMFDWSYHSVINGNYIIYPANEGTHTTPEGMAVYNWVDGSYVQNDLGYWFTDATASPNLIGGTNGTYFLGDSYGNASAIYWYNLDATLGSPSMVWPGFNSAVVSMVKNDSAPYTVYAVVRSTDRGKLYALKGTSTADLLSSSFTHIPSPSTVNSVVSLTDTSDGVPTTWNWTIDGSVTNTTQNAAYTFASFGTYPITLNVTNATGHFSEITHNQVVTNVTSFHQQDIYLTGQYTITFNVKSSTTNLPIANVTVVDAVSGQSYPSTNGTAFLTEPAGLIYVNFIADGYQTKQVTYVVDQDETHEVKLVPSAPASGGTSNWYSPHQVRFAVVDSREAKVVGAGINASVIVSTFPQDGTADWLTEMYGINADVANDMLNGTLIMHGITQSDGATVFTMHSSIGYSLAVTNPSNGVIQTVNVTPIDTIYTIHLLGSAANNTYMDMGYNTSLYVTEPDVHNVTMNLAYQDMSARTTLLEFFVLARSNNTVINYQSTSSTGSNVILMNFTVPNIKPDRYSWYYNAVRIK